MPTTPWYQQGPLAADLPRGREPQEAAPIGAARDEPFGVYLSRVAMEALERQWRDHPTRSASGFLLGQPLQGEKRPFLLVTGILPFPASDGDDEPRFTPQTLAAMEKAWSQQRPGAFVAGWFHARPKRGVALSDFDRFTHFRLFRHEWQVALVVDTERDASLLYRWSGSELHPLDNFYYWQGPAGAEPIAAVAAKTAPGAAASMRSPTDRPSGATESAPGAGRPWLRWLFLLVAVYLLLPGAPGGLQWLHARVAQENVNLAQLQSELKRLEEEQARLDAASRSATLPSDPNPVEQSDALPTSQLSTASSDAEPPLRQEPTPPAFNANYVVQPGDTMWKISEELMGDPREYARLATVNEINDPDWIFPGQHLRLPLDPAVP